MFLTFTVLSTLIYLAISYTAIIYTHTKTVLIVTKRCIVGRNMFYLSVNVVVKMAESYVMENHLSL